MNRLLKIIAAACLLAGCARSEYDITHRLDPEMNLFSDHLTVPLFDLAPISFSSVMEGSAASLVSAYLSTDDDGNYIVDMKSTISEVSPLMLVFSSAAGTYTDSDEASTSVIGALLAYAGLECGATSYEISVNNTLLAPMTFSGKVRMVSDEDGSTVAQFDFSGVSVAAQSEQTVGTMALPDGFDPGDGTILYDFSIDIPENLMLILPEDYASIELNCRMMSDIIVSENFSISMTESVDSLGANIADLRISGCTIAFDAVNSFPFGISLENIVLKSEDGTSVAAVLEEPIGAGTIEAPCRTEGKITVKAEEGSYLPDFDSMSMKISLKSSGQTGKLSERQACALKDFKLTIANGITLFGNDE